MYNLAILVMRLAFLSVSKLLGILFKGNFVFRLEVFNTCLARKQAFGNLTLYWALACWTRLKRVVNSFLVLSFVVDLVESIDHVCFLDHGELVLQVLGLRGLRLLEGFFIGCVKVVLMGAKLKMLFLGSQIFAHLRSLLLLASFERAFMDRVWDFVIVSHGEVGSSNLIRHHLRRCSLLLELATSFGCLL